MFIIDLIRGIFGSLPMLFAFAFLLVCAGFWVYQFALLMRRREDSFASPHDKAYWVAAFVFASVLGAAAYWVWKQMSRNPEGWLGSAGPDEEDGPTPPPAP